MAKRPRKTPDLPPKLMGSTVVVLSDDPLVGVLLLDTDQGAIEVAVNRVVAEDLAEQVAEFLSAAAAARH